MSTYTPPLDSRDAAWVTVPVPQSADDLARHCRDIEALFRINPYLYFSVWRQIGPDRYHVEFENQSNQQKVTVDFEVAPGPGPGFTVSYAGGLKKRTVFAIEPAATGSQLTITDDYDRQDVHVLQAHDSMDGGGRTASGTAVEGRAEAAENASAEERTARAAEADKSLHAWGVALRAYFLRLRRWSWLPGWRWYIRRVWVPMRPSARRIVWLLYLITVVEFFFFLFVLLIYLVEQQNR